MTGISARLQAIRAEIATLSPLKEPQSPQILAVVKHQPQDRLKELSACDIDHWGENYLQQLRDHQRENSRRDLFWHYIGKLQSGKIRQIAKECDWLQSFDRPDLAAALSQARMRVAPSVPLQVLIQVVLTDEANNEPKKGGVQPHLLEATAEALADQPGVRLRGLMVLPPLTDDVALRRTRFAQARRLLDDIRSTYPRCDTLSAGTSADWREAVMEGSTMIRLGQSLIGPRPEPTRTST